MTLRRGFDVMKLRFSLIKRQTSWLWHRLLLRPRHLRQSLARIMLFVLLVVILSSIYVFMFVPSLLNPLPVALRPGPVVVCEAEDCTQYPLGPYTVIPLQLWTDMLWYSTRNQLTNLVRQGGVSKLVILGRLCRQPRIVLDLSRYLSVQLFLVSADNTDCYRDETLASRAKYLHLESDKLPSTDRASALYVSPPPYATIGARFSAVSGLHHVGVILSSNIDPVLLNGTIASLCNDGRYEVHFIFIGSTKRPPCDAPHHEHGMDSVYYRLLARIDVLVDLRTTLNVNVFLSALRVKTPVVVTVPDAYASDPLLRRMLFFDSTKIAPEYLVSNALPNIFQQLSQLQQTSFTFAFTQQQLANTQFQKTVVFNGFKMEVPVALTLPEIADVSAKNPVCIVTFETSLRAGGAGTVVDAQIRHLANNMGVVVAVDGPFEEWKQLLPQSVKVVPLSALSNRNTIAKTKNGHISRSLYILEAVQKLNWENNCRMIEVHDFEGVGFSLAFARHTGVAFHDTPIVIRLHGTFELISMATEEIYDQLGSPLYEDMYEMERLAMQLADFIVSTSEENKQLYSKAYDIPPSKIVVTGLPFDYILTLPPEGSVVDMEAIKQSSAFLVYGRVHQVKRLSFILEAFAKLMDKGQFPDAQLIIAGPDQLCDDKHFGCLKSFIGRHTHHVAFLGSLTHDQLPEISKTVRAAVFASKFETLCLSAHELYALRTPLIVPDVVPFNSFFDQSNSIVYTNGQRQSLVAAMEVALLEGPAFTRAMSFPSLHYDFVDTIYKDPHKFHGVRTLPSAEMVQAALNLVSQL